ncbi:MAG TPA: M20/M25/M40 family metallo-hydrolase [Candidatus Fimisoma avicola]|uniref:M20/M25/M40 family metallo-hydrolase n=1 Tax=Candidatus Fimisoma avicola TaxID=2840826 RepID=A0A9D1I4G5_9FIRM|nr:M20/M25/M40 family metallo-hydrolase [Candidatus Fimisoma avicola]
MNAELSKRIKEIAVALVSQKSIVETYDEVTMSDKVYELMSEMDYYKEHPDKLYFVPVKDDPWNRKIVVAVMTGEKKPSDKTVVFIGHTDTVGISDYGNLAEYATRPDELIDKLKEVSLTQEVKDDMASGKYMFGRGIFDMKSGDANIIGIMEYISKDIKNFEGNIVFAAVCDEEGNSQGMLTFVPELIRLKEKFGFDYQAMLDPDYIAPAYPGDPNVYQYIGTVGKLMPTFYIVGKETHVGESFSGLDPNQIAAEITRRVNLNPEFSDVVEGEVTLPPITLKQRDLKPEYSVQIASKAILFFNYATHSSTPADVMNKMVETGQECFENVVAALNERYEKFCHMSGRDYKALPWKARTMSFDSLVSEVRKEIGDGLDDMIKAYAKDIMKDSRYDARDKTMKVVEYVHSLWSDKNPVLIVYLTPPYYPHIYVEGTSPKEKVLIDAVNYAVTTTKSDYKLMQKKFLPCISDLSYAAAPKEPQAIEALKQNMPGFGVIYDLPIEEMQELDLPVADIGAYGKDAHQFTERVETVYSYEVLPEILYKTMMHILQQ